MIWNEQAMMLWRCAPIASEDSEQYIFLTVEASFVLLRKAVWKDIGSRQGECLAGNEVSQLPLQHFQRQKLKWLKNIRQVVSVSEGLGQPR